ncbi:OsmC family protein [Paucibacter soli]|uniref:OsmC family protein n=1 Tax=Paucibacter soli TaxID=3133433 RepID=UPI0030B6866E
MRNGIPVAAVSELTEELRQDPAQGLLRYGVGIDWQNGTRGQVQTLPLKFGHHQVSRDFSWIVDEPRQIGGGNHGPSPQEFLLAGVAACIMVGFTVGASIMGVQLESLRVELHGELDLAGFLGLAEASHVPLKRIDYRIIVSGDGTPEQFETLRREAVAHSPNAMSVAKGVPLSGELMLA